MEDKAEDGGGDADYRKMDDDMLNSSCVARPDREELDDFE